jgi:hypothetical protein
MQYILIPKNKKRKKKSFQAARESTARSNGINGLGGMGMRVYAGISCRALVTASASRLCLMAFSFVFKTITIAVTFS